MPSRYVPEDRPLIGLRRGVIGLHYGLKLRWIRFDSVPVLEWIVITGSLLGLALALEKSKGGVIEGWRRKYLNLWRNDRLGSVPWSRNTLECSDSEYLLVTRLVLHVGRVWIATGRLGR